MQTDRPEQQEQASKLSTHEQFAQDYADSIGRTVKDLVDAGMAVAPCACGSVTCRGWYITWPGVCGELIHDVPSREQATS